MKTRKPWMTLTASLVCGALAAFLALAYGRAQAVPPGAAAPIQDLVVATRDLPAGARVRPEDLKLIPWPGAALPSGYIGSIQEVVGHGLVGPVRANEPVLASKLAGKEQAGLPVLIPAGMRAVSVRVDEVVAVAGFVVPGTRVDVLVTHTPERDRPTTRTQVILQNVQVMAAGQSIQADADGKPQTTSVITLLVTPAEAELLTLAATEGQIQLALRNVLDGEESRTGGAWVGSLVGASQPPAAKPAASSQVSRPRRNSRQTLEIYQGSTRSVATF